MSGFSKREIRKPVKSRNFNKIVIPFKKMDRRQKSEYKNIYFYRLPLVGR